MKNIYIRRLSGLYLFTFFLMIFCSATVSAQVNMTKIKDGSVVDTSTLPVSGAVLELESSNRGFLTPRMTTGQRDAIPAEKRTQGLLIFNTTTGCFNFWNTLQSTWSSICGTPPPAVFEISSTQCTNIVANGTYQQGDDLTNSNYLSIPVTVTQPGTYDVVANTTNGYYFSISGTFPNSGTYTLNLPGNGVPNQGYNVGEQGDTVSITLNGVPNGCEPHVFVEKAAIDYELACGTASQLGNYYVGIPVNASNKISITVNVTTLGFWSIFTNTVNGYSFSGTGNFTTTGSQQVLLSATGTPVASGTDSFTISSNSDSFSSCSGVIITVAPVAYSMDCATATVNGTLLEDVASTNANTITLPVNVTATGATSITTNTVNGISYASGPVTFSELGIQNVILYASGTPATAGTTTLTVTGTPGSIATCTVNVPVAAQPVAYSMTCGSIVLSGNYAPNVTMTAANTMSVTVDVSYVGSYSITTDVQNGVSFSGTGTFSTTGSQTVVLTATGTPTAGGTFVYTLSSNSTSGTTTCTKSVQFVFRTVRILGLGGGVYQLASASASETSRAVVQSTVNFGPAGVVNVQSIVITNGAFNEGTNLKALINNNNIDIIVIGSSYSPNATSIGILNDFVKNKKGVLIHGQETDLSGNKDLFDLIIGGSITIVTTNPTSYNPTLNVDDPILNGPFGDMRNKAIGSDVNSSNYVTGLPATVTALAHQNGNTDRVLLFKHNTLGYMYIGDSGWTAGNATTTATTTYPAKMTSTGLPLSKAYSGGTVYNSYIYANAMAWAIKYAQENTITTYVIP